MDSKMKRINISDIGNLAEAVSAIGVVVTLIYLALQIQQNTNVLRASSYQEIANGATEWQMVLAQNENLTRIYVTGVENPELLMPEEQAQFGMFLGMLFAKFEIALELYQRGMVDEKLMTPYTRFIMDLLKMPGISDYWKQSQHFFSDDLRYYIRERSGVALD